MAQHLVNGDIHLYLEFFSRITTENIDILTEIGILYLRINDTKGAFDKLFEVTKSHENCSKALLALGSILQVLTTMKTHPSYEITTLFLVQRMFLSVISSQKMMSMERSTSTSSLIRRVRKVPKYGTMSGYVFIRKRNLLRYS